MFIEKFKEITFNCFLKDWNEMNGGNISYRLKQEDIETFPYEMIEGEWIALNQNLKFIANDFFYMTGSGQYFQRVKDSLETTSGLIELNSEGTHYRIRWGFKGGRPTSELPTHLHNFNVMCEADDEYRVVLHVHPTNIIVLSALFESDIELTKSLWRVMTECLVIFPNGIKFIEWMIPGNIEIGIETAKHILDYDLVFWRNHGGFVKAKSFDQAFGTMHTIDKAAGIYLDIIKSQIKPILISDEDLRALADEFKVKVNSRYEI